MKTLSTIMLILAALNSLAVAKPVGPIADEATELRGNKPNIIVFLVDDMGVMDTSVPFLTDATGKPKRYPLNEYYRTPNMERLAAQGIRFNNFEAMSVCSPSRISIMTGQNAARHRTTTWIHQTYNNRGPQGPPDWNWKGLTKTDLTLPRLLEAADYRTIHIGKGHFGPRQSEGEEPKNLGFDRNIAGCADGQPGSYYGQNNYASHHHKVPGLDKYHGTDTFLSEALTLEAKAQLTETVKEGIPFYLYFAHYAVHTPLDADPRFAERYKTSGKSARAQAFATLIEGMDKSLGDILDHLNELGVAENTLILFLGDNGSDAPLGNQNAVACAAPLRGKKGSHYEGGMRVPFIAAWAKTDPGNPYQKRLPIQAGVIQPQLASVCDIFPTVLSFLDIATPNGHTVDGFPLNTLLTGKPDTTRPEAFLMHYPHTHRSDYFTSYRCGDWKIIYHYFPSGETDHSHYQLYNLVSDPFESKNLAATQPAQLRVMMEGLIAALEQNKALYPVDKDGQSQRPLLPPQSTTEGL